MSARVLPLLTSSIVALAILPIVFTKHPPLGDYFNHLARAHVIALHGRDPILAQFYAIGWRLIPNLALDIIVPPLAGLVGIYAAGKLFLLLTLALLIAGPHAIHRALMGRWSLAPLIVTLFLYNNALTAGLLNYLFGVGLALFGIAAWIKLSPGPAGRRIIVSTIFVLPLYVCHLAACGLYGITLLGYELWQARKTRDDWHWRAAALILPFIFLPALAMLWPGRALGSAVQWTAYDKLRAFLFIIESQPSYRLPDAIAGALLIIGALWAWWRGVLRVHPAAWIVGAIGFLAFLATPVRIMGAWGADVRLPLGLLFLLIGFLHWERPTAPARRLFLGAMLLFVALRIGVVEYAWRDLDNSADEMVASFDLIRPGSKVLVAQADQPKGRGIEALWYLPCAVMIERSSLCSLAFSDPRQQVLRVKPPFRAMAGGYSDDPPPVSELLAPPSRSSAAPSGRIYWKGWQEDYNYLYVLRTAGDPNPLPHRLRKIDEGQHFQLYAIESDGKASRAPAGQKLIHRFDP